MSDQLSVPRHPDEVTTAWLDAALRRRHPDVRVTATQQTNVLWGTATKVFLDVEYADAPVPGGPGTKLCVKGELDDRVRGSFASWGATPTQVEAAFYDQLAPRMTVPVSPAYATVTEDGVGGVLVMDDLNEQGVVFGDPREPWTTDAVASGLDALAALHGSTWGQDFSDVPVIAVGSPTVRGAVDALFSEQSWEHTFGADTAPPLPAAIADRERILKAYHASYALDDAAAHSIVHGDAHLGNAFLTRDGRAIFLDWAGPCLAPWSFDVGYFVTGALTVEDRRAAERDLVAHYFDRLVAHGGPRLDAEEAWNDVRRHQLHGLIWAMLPTTMHPTESVHAMTTRYAAGVEDHDTLALLGA